MHLTHLSFFRLWPSPCLLKKATFDSIFLAIFIEKKGKKNYWNFDSSSVFTFEIWSQIYDHPVDMIDYNYDSKNS